MYNSSRDPNTYPILFKYSQLLRTLKNTKTLPNISSNQLLIRLRSCQISQRSRGQPQPFFNFFQRCSTPQNNRNVIKLPQMSYLINFKYFFEVTKGHEVNLNAYPILAEHPELLKTLKDTIKFSQTSHQSSS